LQKIKPANSPSPDSLPVDNRIEFLLLIVKANLLRILRLPTFSVNIVKITTTTRLITEQLSCPNNRKRLDLMPKMDLKKSLAFVFEEINALKR
jgi:hypothetical protein